MSLANELRANYRLRIGLTLIASIVWLSWLLDLRDQINVMMDHYRQTASQLARFNAQQKQKQWLTRAQEAKSALAATEERVWQSPSLGLTQAEMRDWLLQKLRQAKAVNPTVKVAESGVNSGESGSSSYQDRQYKSGKPDDAPADLVRVRAQLEFKTDPMVLNNLLAAFADAERQIVVEVLTVKQPRAELTVVVWYKLRPATTVPTAPPPVAER